MMNAVFREKCRSEEGLSKGLRRVEHLCGRDRLLILPEISKAHGSELIPTSALPTPALRTAEAL